MLRVAQQLLAETGPSPPLCDFFFSSLFCTGMQSVNTVVIVSGEQQRDSVIHAHAPILLQTSLPSRLPHPIEESALCYMVGPCWLACQDGGEPASLQVPEPSPRERACQAGISALVLPPGGDSENWLALPQPLAQHGQVFRNCALVFRGVADPASTSE